LQAGVEARGAALRRVHTARLGETAGSAGNAAEDRWVTGRSASFATGMAKAIATGDDNARRDMRSALNRARIKRETYAACRPGPDAPRGQGAGAGAAE